VQITTDNREHFKNYDLAEPYFGAAPEALLEGFQMLTDVEVHVISCIRQEVKSTKKLGENIFFHSLLVPKIGWMSSGYYGCSHAIRSLCAEIKPDIVHGQGSERDCAISAARSGFPNIITIHGNIKELNRLKMFGSGLYGPLASFFETRSMKSTVGVFCNSLYTKNLVEKRAKKTWLVPNAIRKAFFTPKIKYSSRSTPTIVNIGVVCARKRQLEILQAIGAIVRQGKKIHITFAGIFSENEPYGQAFARELRKAEAAGYASFAGHLHACQLIELLDEADGFVHFPTEEAFGLVVAEALARGLKFFGSNLGGIMDITADIEGAELHEDIQSLKAGIINWIDAGAPQAKGVSATIASRYHPKVIAQRHIEIYQEVLGKI